MVSFRDRRIVSCAAGIILLAAAARYENAQMSADAPGVPGQNVDGMHVFLWAG
jgi:hypothetical protein